MTSLRYRSSDFPPFFLVCFPRSFTLHLALAQRPASQKFLDFHTHKETERVLDGMAGDVVGGGTDLDDFSSARIHKIRPKMPAPSPSPTLPEMRRARSQVLACTGERVCKT